MGGRGLWAGVLAIIVWVPAAARGADTAAVAHVPGPTVARLFREAFAGTRVRLHNLGRERANGALLSWHEREASFIRLGPLVGGVEARFTIPEHVVDAGPNGHLKYYVNEVTARSMTVEWQDAGVRLIFRLQGTGAALKGLHTAFSRSLRDIGAPDVALKEIRIQAILPPAERARSIAYEPVRVEFGAEVAAASACHHKGIDLCADARRFSARLGALVARELTALLNREDVRDRAAEALRIRLPDLMRAAGAVHFGEVMRVTAAADVLAIHYKSR